VPSIGAGVYAYLPAPGQFTNEGVNVGGWGDIYVSGSTALKGMVNGMSGTGVSLGFFGGYVVADMGETVANAASNPYGVDFIVYGNAFSGNSEPGCIQVAQGVQVDGGYVPGDANNDGVVWYDIAGCLHYRDGTVWDASYTYTNPVPDDNNVTTYPTLGTVYNAGVTYTYSNVPRPGSPAATGTDKVDYNAYHQHSWFPLYANYFIGRNGIGAMDHVTGLPFAALSGDTLQLRGVMLGGVTNTQTANYTFGYADVHPNGSNFGTAVNPYAATASTTGGDGIDISWAVKPDGTPADLSGIRFVRVYTGAARMNPPFGEISTELCGIYKAVGTGGSAASSDLEIWDSGELNQFATAHMGSRNLSAGNYVLFSEETYVYLNGEIVGDADTGHAFTVAVGDTIQIITQSGYGEAYITVIKGVS